MLSNVLMLYCCGIILLNRMHENPIMVAMCLRNIHRIKDIIGGLLHGIGSIEEQMSKIQRIFNMQEIVQEKQVSTISADQILKEWPDKANISIKDVELRYRPKTEKVLKGLTLDIQAGHKIGVVGRTGAGKSTLSLALTRIIELEKGQIVIDGIDISEIPLKSLRDKITIIPQDPTLF
jgi:ATP-binding cassette subfamily C (CFTR/MRP) protein 1